MKILYVTYIDSESAGQLGVVKKIKAQIKALSFENEVALICYHGSSVVLEKGGLQKRFDSESKNYRVAMNEAVLSLKDDYDAFYFRLPGFIDASFFGLLKKLKRASKTNVIEIPTYPLKGELLKTLDSYRAKHMYFHLVTRAFAYCLHWVLSKGVHKYVDLIVTFMQFDRIWNTETLCVDNGVDTESCPVAEAKASDGRLRMTVVGNIAKWHGVDRMIDGLCEYYSKNGTRDISFSVIGESSLIEELKTKVASLGLSSRVFFKGKKTGQALFEEYLDTDIAIGSLGMHRIGVINGSTLKVKEYASYGKPFVYAYNEKQLSEDFPFALKLCANDEPIQIEKILGFYDKVAKIEGYPQKLHDFAVEKFDWKLQMRQISDRLKASSEVLSSIRTGDSR